MCFLYSRVTTINCSANHMKLASDNVNGTQQSNNAKIRLINEPNQPDWQPTNDIRSEAFASVQVTRYGFHTLHNLSSLYIYRFTNGSHSTKLNHIQTFGSSWIAALNWRKKLRFLWIISVANFVPSFQSKEWKHDRLTSGMLQWQSQRTCTDTDI